MSDDGVVEQVALALDNGHGASEDEMDAARDALAVLADDLATIAKALRWHVAPIRKTDERPYMDALAAIRRLETASTREEHDDA